MIIAACLAFLVFSFHSRVRFAHPVTEHFARWAEDFHCYHDAIYEGPVQRDALFFGASRTLFAFEPRRVEDAYRTVTGRSIDVFAFSTAWPNPELAYFAFRDYLQNNPAPGSALFELTTALPLEEPVRYVNPLFPFLAPPYLYGAELASWSFVKSPLFALSDTLRLFIRHIDLSMTNLLVVNRKFLVPPGDNCALSAPATDSPVPELTQEQLAQISSFDTLLSAEAEALLPPGGWEQAGDYTTLLDHYADKPAILRQMESFGPGWSGKKLRRLFYRGPLKDRALSYYQRILELGQAHGVNVAFYVMPNVYQPEATTQQLAFESTKVGAPVHIIPFRYARVSYHHYRDRAHVLPEATGLMSAWAASLIDGGELD